MDKIFLTTGPTELFPQIKELLNEALENKIFCISHRSEQFSEIVKDVNLQLKKLLDIPDDFYIFFLSSATESMERLIENLVETKSFHFINGAFARRFYDISLMLGKDAGCVEAPDGSGFDFNNIDIPTDAEMVCFTHNETSTGVALKNDDICNLKRKYTDKIFAVDVVTSVPYYKFNFDFIDAAFFSVQKGFGLPSGLGVLIVRKNLIEKTKQLQNKKINIGSYNNFIRLAANADKFQTTMTPNISDIYLLGKICWFMNDYGIENIPRETKIKSEMLYSFFENSGTFKPFAENKDIRSDTTIVIDAPADTKKLLSENGFEVSSGYGEYKDRQIRIGNFPMHTIENVKSFINTIKKINLNFGFIQSGYSGK